MERHFDTQLKALKEKILTMGGCVERGIEEALKALLDREPERFEQVELLEHKVNQSHMQVDEACVQLLAQQSPLARDLRLIIAIIKINTDLERMSDQAINISHSGRRYLSAPALKPLVDTPKMAQEVRTMVREALDAFVRQDLALARRCIQRDDTVDELKRRIFDDVRDIMAKDPTTIDRGLNLILIARNLERIGDHATNIAEDVIFAISGEDIRHGGAAPPGDRDA